MTEAEGGSKDDRSMFAARLARFKGTGRGRHKEWRRRRSCSGFELVRPPRLRDTDASTTKATSPANAAPCSDDQGRRGRRDSSVAV